VAVAVVIDGFNRSDNGIYCYYNLFASLPLFNYHCRYRVKTITHQTFATSSSFFLWKSLNRAAFFVSSSIESTW
jgi:hypothetical protein